MRSGEVFLYAVFNALDVALSCDLFQHKDPDYSVAYVVLDTDTHLKGFGLTFTVGRGTEIGELYRY